VSATLLGLFQSEESNADRLIGVVAWFSSLADLKDDIIEGQSATEMCIHLHRWQALQHVLCAGAAVTSAAYRTLCAQAQAEDEKERRSRIREAFSPLLLRC
jgi:hypothetical protein